MYKESKNMFSYCKKNNINKDSQFLYDYYVNPLQTAKGFGRDPSLCNNIQMPFVQHRGLPRNLLDAEAKLKGQDPSVQPYCSNQKLEGSLQFSTFGWLQDQPIPKGPIPSGPVPMIEVKSYGSPQCQHPGGFKPCGGNCGCSHNCQCKDMFHRNMTSKPALGMLPMTQVPGCKF